MLKSRGVTEVIHVGSCNVRKVKTDSGEGKEWSIHSWCAGLDIQPPDGISYKEMVQIGHDAGFLFSRDYSTYSHVHWGMDGMRQLGAIPPGA